jgi:site-specific DNA-methyltransferase (adenine-specific)
MLDFGYYNMDCMDGMKEFPDGYFDLAIVDPVYGDVKQGGYMKNIDSTKKLAKPNQYNDAIWKQPKTNKEYFDELFRVSKHQIIWGGNYFTEEISKNSTCWIVWDKVNTGNFADCELAWTSFDTATRIFRFMWNGMMQGKSIEHGEIQQGDKSKNEKRIHPTQKPVLLYFWLLQNYAKPKWRLLDTHVGSASSLIAFEDKGYEYVGFEKEKVYYDLSTNRLNEYKAQMTIFDFGIAR